MKLRNIFSSILIGLLLVSCSKTNLLNDPFVSLNIVNVVAGGPSVKLNNYAATIANNANLNVGAVPGTNRIYVFPLGDSLHPYINDTRNYDASGIYSLFIGGTPSTIDTLFLKESVYSYRTDSSFGVRIVNLASNSPAINVTLSTTPASNEFSSVSYKQATNFKYFFAGSASTSYTFQIRNASTNAVLASLSIANTSIPRNRDITLVFRGVVGGSPATGITRVNHY